MLIQKAVKQNKKITFMIFSLSLSMLKREISETHKKFFFIEFKI